ncbi:tRNA pseudouridine(38-40) synthase TruA [Maribacter sp. MMG018]|uniref:tRNA pseudouridine synthase A n=1 Tax=Maribacter sp. MMG018 TaxID=2822688 RepID=UPI001B372F35|nr:tRNA pseudouridine(38-40) synthase TruA [Maribacter sp. MMG018]MBQ4915166.1 tRNA pseudouridine(38-40) synthase TruA [Maribacter sp. MMG018]
MRRSRFYYLVRIQYLGFRYSGWQQQPDRLTIEGMLVKTLKFILKDTKFKLLGAGRTDAKVSALDGVFELFVEEKELTDLNGFLLLFNKNLPQDIKVTEITPTTADFNIIQHSKSKEYVYLFSYGEKNHPFCAPYLTNVMEELDIELMINAAKLYEGTHDFSSYTARLRPNAKVVRTIDFCGIGPNTLIKASFFPNTSYALTVRGQGFMRYQIRMIMGALLQVGMGNLCIEDIKASLIPENNIKMTTIAPGSGLLLNEVNFG